MTDWFGADSMIPHGFCLSWNPNLMAAVIVSNAVIALAYMIITMVLVGKAIERRPAIPRWVFWSYATFIFCCGMTHVMENLTVWWPIYRLQAILLAMTALVSLFAAVLPVSVWVKREADHWRKGT